MENDNLPTLLNADDGLRNKIQEMARKRHQEITDAATPSDYIKSKPLGGRSVNYVPATYMDNKFKQEIPLYANTFAFPPFVFQNWIIVGVELRDRTTGNVELGLKAHRIQFNAEKKKAVTGYVDKSGDWNPPTMDIGQLTPFDMVDVGNDVSACLTEAIKNAQSRFGICADIYEKKIISEEDLRTLETDFQEYLNTIKNPVMKGNISREWKACKSPADKLFYLQELKGDN